MTSQTDLEPDGEAEEEERRRICILCEELVDTLDDHDAESEEALKALTSVIAAIICNHIPTKRQADATLSTVVGALTATIKSAEEMGQAEWVRNRAN